jgi:uncharacterized membrane protein
MTLIEPISSSLLWAIIMALAGFGFWVERNTRIGRMMTGVIVAMAAAMVLANLRVIPTEAPAYDTIFSTILPLSIPLLLFRADLRRAIREGGPTLWAFGIGSVGVVLGVFIATALVPLGELKAIAGGLYTATYTGGSLNFSAVAIATEFNRGGDLTSMLAADIIATNLQTMLLIALPGIALIRRLFGEPEKADQHRNPPTEIKQETTSFVVTKFDLAGASLALAVAFALVAAGHVIAGMAGRESLGILITSALALIVGNFMRPLVARMSGDFEMGTFLIFLFLIAIACGADVWVLIESGPVFMIYTGIVLGFHTLFLLVMSYLIKPYVAMDIRSIVIGSTACVGGITTASAIASAKGWKDLIVPGIMAGTLGNAIGSFLGVWVWSYLS